MSFWKQLPPKPVTNNYNLYDKLNVTFSLCLAPLHRVSKVMFSAFLTMELDTGIMPGVWPAGMKPMALNGIIVGLSLRLGDVRQYLSLSFIVTFEYSSSSHKS